MRFPSGVIVADVTNVEIICDDQLFTNHIGGSYVNVRLHNGFLYAAASEGGVDIFDISDPDAPQRVYQLDELVSSTAVNFTVNDIQLQGNFLYIAAEQVGLAIYDITNPLSPVLRGTLPAPFPFVLTLNGSVAYMGYDGTTIGSIDISNPNNPTFLDQLVVTPVDEPSGITIDGSFAYVSGWADDFAVINISNPSNLSIATFGPIANFSGYQSTLRGDLLLKSQSSPIDGFSILDVTNPTAPTVLSTITIPSGRGLVTDADFSTDGQTAFLANGALQAYDISDPINPSFLSESAVTTIPGTAIGLQVDQDRLYVANASGGLSTFDVSDPSNLVERSTTGSLSNARDVAIRGERALVIDSVNALKVCDLSDPFDITVISELLLPAFPFHRQIALYENLAFVSSIQRGLHIVDVTDIDSPALITTLNGIGSVFDAQLLGTSLFVGTTNGVGVFDIGDPANPAPLTTVATAGFVGDLLLDGTTLYVANSAAGFFVYDVSSPATPVLLGGFDTAGQVQEFTKFNDLLFIADGGDGSTSGLVIVNVSDPTNIQLLSTTATPSLATDVALSQTGETAYVTDTLLGSRVYDVSDPMAPQLIETFDIGDSDRSIAVHEDVVYVASEESGLEVMKFRHP